MTRDHTQLSWRKSSYSSSQENCVEVAWRKSSYSGSQENCVEIALAEREVLLRDSKRPEGGVLTVTPAAFAALCRHTGS